MSSSQARVIEDKDHLFCLKPIKHLRILLEMLIINNSIDIFIPLFFCWSQDCVYSFRWSYIYDQQKELLSSFTR